MVNTVLSDQPDVNALLTIIGVSLTFSLFTEVVMWFLIYRHEDYKKAVAEIVVLQERVEGMQERMTYSLGTQSVSQQKA